MRESSSLFRSCFQVYTKRCDNTVIITPDYSFSFLISNTNDFNLSLYIYILYIYVENYINIFDCPAREENRNMIIIFYTYIKERL
jgi:hypothetical protein